MKSPQNLSYTRMTCLNTLARFYVTNQQNTPCGKQGKSLQLEYLFEAYHEQQNFHFE